MRSLRVASINDIFFPDGILFNQGLVKVGAVNTDDSRELGAKYDVRGFPSIKIFGANKNKPEDYQSARTADGLVNSAFQHLRTMVNSRLSGKQSSSSSSSSSSGSGSEGSKGKGDVITLTDDNFDEMVLKSDEPWLVEFFAPWCGHCKRLEPEWASAASKLKGRVKLGALDATTQQATAQRFGVRGYPTIKFFPGGKKSGDSSAVEYDGGRDAASIESWAGERAAVSLSPPEVVELTGPNVFTAECEKKPLCVISFMPDILDCQSACRNGFIDTMRKLGDKFKRQGWGWLWTSAGAQPALEQAVGIGGYGYPAMVALSAKKSVYSPLKLSFNFKSVDEFLFELSIGRGPAAQALPSQLPKIEKVEKWDGKDGVLPADEDIDVSDINLDDENMVPIDVKKKKSEL